MILINWILIKKKRVAAEIQICRPKVSVNLGFLVGDFPCDGTLFS